MKILYSPENNYESVYVVDGTPEDSLASKKFDKTAKIIIIISVVAMWIVGAVVFPPIIISIISSVK